MEVKALQTIPVTQGLKENAIDQPDGHSRMRRNKIFGGKTMQKMDDNSVSPIKTVYSDIASMKILNNQLNHEFDKFEDFKEGDLDGSD